MNLAMSSAVVSIMYPFPPQIGNRTFSPSMRVYGNTWGPTLPASPNPECVISSGSKMLSRT